MRTERRLPAFTTSSTILIGVEMEADANGEHHLRVIHAMALRQKYQGQHEEAKKWRA